VLQAKQVFTVMLLLVWDRALRRVRVPLGLLLLELLVVALPMLVMVAVAPPEMAVAMALTTMVAAATDLKLTAA
jgi:hypothetical protein